MVETQCNVQATSRVGIDRVPGLLPYALLDFGDVTELEDWLSTIDAQK